MNQYVIFTSNNQHFALNISEIDKIIEYEEPKLIPESESYFLGVIQYAQRVLPIIDLTTRLYNINLVRNTSNKIIVVMIEGTQLGLLVDDIIGIKTYENHQIEESGRDINIPNQYIQGFIKTDDNITIVLHSSRLLSPAQKKEILSTAEIS